MDLTKYARALNWTSPAYKTRKRTQQYSLDFKKKAVLWSYEPHRSVKEVAKASLRQQVGHYIQHFYNTVRLHSSLDYVSPIQYEQAA